MITRLPHQEVEHIWSRDPALDRSHPEAFEAAWKKFRETGDAAALPTKNGATPAVWILSGLKRRHKLRNSPLSMELSRRLMKNGMGIDGIMGEALLESHDFYVQVGLVAVRGYADEHGQPVVLARVDDGQGGKILSGDAMEDLHGRHLGTHFINELGFRIREMSEPDPTSGQA
jgi:hypothetical protein